MTFCDIVWSLSLRVRMECRRNTECTCNFAPRPDGDFIYFLPVFFLKIICVTSPEFSCLRWQPVINFFAATVKHVGAEAGPVQNPAGFHNENIMNFKQQISIRGVKKIASKHWQPLKRNVVTSSKEVLWIDFERKKLYSGTRLAWSCRPKDLRQLRLVWTGADDVLRLQTDVWDEVGDSGKSRM